MDTRPLLLLVLLPCLACPTRARRDDDDTADDDDDSAGRDDDDDATAADDDDATPTAQSPSIVAVQVCQSTTLLGSNGIFEIEVEDAQGNLSAPVTYRVQVDGGSNVSFTWDGALGGHGWIDHVQSIGTAPLLRGTEHTWTFTVLDDAGNLSGAVELAWTIPTDPQGQACGG
jgi:hypothetical protein